MKQTRMHSSLPACPDPSSLRPLPAPSSNLLRRFPILFTVPTALALSFSAFPAPSSNQSLFIKGRAVETRPIQKTSKTGQPSTPILCDFELLINNEAFSCLLTVSGDRRVEGILYTDGREIISVYPTLAGEEQFGPAKGAYNAQAFIGEKDLFATWANIPGTLLLPYWTARFPLDNPQLRIPNLSIRYRDERESTYLPPRIQGAFPASGGHLYFSETDRGAREIWTSSASTNIAGITYPLEYCRQILRRPINIQNGVKALDTDLFSAWKVVASEIRMRPELPHRPEPAGPTKFHDRRLTGNSITYIADHWRTPEDLLSDTNILNQMRAVGRSVTDRASTGSGKDRNPRFVFYVLATLAISISCVGALQCARTKCSKP